MFENDGIRRLEGMIGDLNMKIDRLEKRYDRQKLEDTEYLTYSLGSREIPLFPKYKLIIDLLLEYLAVELKELPSNTILIKKKSK